MTVVTMWSPATGSFQYNTDSGLALPPGATQVGGGSSSSSGSVPTPPVSNPGMSAPPTASSGGGGGGYSSPVSNPGMSSPVPMPPSNNYGSGYDTLPGKAPLAPKQQEAFNPSPMGQAAIDDYQRRIQMQKQLQEKMNALRNSANGLKNNLQNDFSRSQQKIQDSRTLNNEQLKRNTNPFSGRTNYVMAQTQREYSQADEAMQRALQDKMAGLDAQLINAETTGQAEMEQQLEAAYQRDRQYALQQEQLEIQRQKEAFDQMNANRNFGLQEGQLTGSYVNPQAAKTLSEILELKRLAESSENPGQYKARADQLREQLATMGVDPSIVGYDADYQTAVGNVSNFRGAPTLAAQNQNFNQNMAVREQDFKEKSYWNTFQETARQFDTETAIKKAYQDGQLSIEKANLALRQAGLAIDQQNANTASKRVDWDMSPNNPSNMPKSRTTSYKENPEFKSEIATINAMTKDEAIADINNNAEAIIETYGYDAYKELLSLARSKK